MGASQMYRALTPDAKATIRAYGLTIAEYVRSQGYSDGEWRGDACGCFDDRCKDGFHHELDDECQCLPAILDELRKAEAQS